MVSAPSSDGTDGPDASIRDMVIEVRNDIKWVKEKLGNICTEIYIEHPKDHRAVEKRLRLLEDADAKLAGLMKESSDNRATAIAVIALIIAAISSAAAIIGG